MDWLICFPSKGNEGRKYLYYTVTFIDRKKQDPEAQVSLVDIIDNPEFENKFPHTIGFFRKSTDEKADLASNYLEIRIISNLEEFWKFLNDLNI